MPKNDITWKPVKNYEGYYEVSSDGQVRSLERKVGRLNGSTGVLKPKNIVITINTNGYPSVDLYKNGKRTTKRVHRLIMESFYPLDVNHINGDQTDNRIENLEWVTRSCNLVHSYHHLARKNKKNPYPSNARKVHRIDPDSGIVLETYRSMSDAGKDGYQISKVSLCCNGKRETHKKFKWSHADDKK